MAIFLLLVQFSSVVGVGLLEYHEHCRVDFTDRFFGHSRSEDIRSNHVDSVCNFSLDRAEEAQHPVSDVRYIIDAVSISVVSVSGFKVVGLIHRLREDSKPLSNKLGAFFAAAIHADNTLYELRSLGRDKATVATAMTAIEPDSSEAPGGSKLERASQVAADAAAEADNTPSTEHPSDIELTPSDVAGTPESASKLRRLSQERDSNSPQLATQVSDPERPMLQPDSPLGGNETEDGAGRALRWHASKMASQRHHKKFKHKPTRGERAVALLNTDPNAAMRAKQEKQLASIGTKYNGTRHDIPQEFDLKTAPDVDNVRSVGYLWFDTLARAIQAKKIMHKLETFVLIIRYRAARRRANRPMSLADRPKKADRFKGTTHRRI